MNYVILNIFNFAQMIKFIHSFIHSLHAFIYTQRLFKWGYSEALKLHEDDFLYDT